MKVVNTRSPEQWSIINKHVDFQGKTAIDLGCGYGDIVGKIRDAGAWGVIGVEKDQQIATDTRYRLGTNRIRIINKDVMGFIGTALAYPIDFSVCFSLLPYLSDCTPILEWMHLNSYKSLIEAQYQGDGPGDEWDIKDDDDMLAMLGGIWDNVEAIGQTFVEGRDKYRTIWLCS